MKNARAERVEILRKCPLFAGLRRTDMERIAGIVAIKKFAAGAPIFFQDDPAAGFYLISTGRVKVYRLGTDGREQVLHIFGSGELVGEVPVFHGGRYPACACAIEKTECGYVPGDKFFAVGRKHPELLVELLAILSMRLRQFVTLIDDLALKEVSARVAKYILDKCAREGSVKVTLTGTKAMLASRLGTIAETLSRTLGKMQSRKIVRVSGPVIEVLDRQALIVISAGGKL